jgi:signal transduction histidine kinase
MQVSSPKQTRRRLGILFSLPLIFCLIFFLFQVRAEQTDVRLLKIQNLQSIVSSLSYLAKDAESSERGFLVTGDSSLLARYRPGDSRVGTPVPEAKLRVQKLTAQADYYANQWPKLHQKMLVLSQYVQTRMDQTEQVWKTQEAEDFAAAVALTKSMDREKTMGQVGQSSLELMQDLNKLAGDDMGQQNSLSFWAFIVFGLGTIAMIAVMYWLYNEVLSYIDSRDQAQEQLEKFNADLQGMVDQRTRELVDANRELQQFAYVASHDLQEPLRTITSFSQLMAARYRGRLEEDADEFIGYIVTASKRMTDLINGLLQMVRLRKAGQPTNRVSFEKLLDDAEASLQALIRENEVRIERAPLPELMVERVQMLQLLQNLISNAIKYRRAEAPVIQIRAERHKSEWLFSVADNGRGFGQEFSERIFGLFTRLHGRDIEGTGMGLSIARRIVERHGGRIWAESKEGQGSTFFFTLPVSLEGGKAAIAASEVSKSSPATRAGKAHA